MKQMMNTIQKFHTIFGIFLFLINFRKKFLSMRAPNYIRSIGELQNEIKLLEAMSEIEIAVTSIAEKTEKKQHKLDYQYNCLKWRLNLVDQKSDIFKVNSIFLIKTLYF